MANISIEELSQTISELIDLDLGQQSLLESAVDRAIAAKDITGGVGISPPIVNSKIVYHPLTPVIAGGAPVPEIYKNLMD